MGHAPTAAIVIIGNEILSGRTEDKNVNFIAKAMLQKGISLMEVRMIADIEEDIITVINALRQCYTYVFTTGGIGPTHDDITADSIAKAFGVSLVRHQDVADALIQYYDSASQYEARLKMADFPEGARLIHNDVTLAPGFVIANVYVMAGIPKIMQAMLTAILPELEAGDEIFSDEVTATVSESSIADGLATIQQTYPSIDIGSYPFKQSNGQYAVSVVLKTTNHDMMLEAKNDVIDLLSEKGRLH